MLKSVKELKSYSELLAAFTIRNIKIKYKQTFMGLLWAIFMPVVIIAAGALVRVGFAKIAGRDISEIGIKSIIIKSAPWAFFTQALKFSVSSLVANMNILKKIYFPRVIFPLSYILGQLFDFIVATGFSVFLLVILRTSVTYHVLWAPLIIILIVMFTAGLGMIFSCGNLYYRDVKYIIDVVLTFAIIFTPVFYDAREFGDKAIILLINPIGAMLDSLSRVVAYGEHPSPIWLTYSAVWAIGTFVFGWYIFHKTEPGFSDHV